jgi:hypothetical protein
MIHGVSTGSRNGADFFWRLKASDVTNGHCFIGMKFRVDFQHMEQLGEPDPEAVVAKSRNKQTIGIVSLSHAHTLFSSIHSHTHTHSHIFHTHIQTFHPHHYIPFEIYDPHSLSHTRAHTFHPLTCTYTHTHTHTLSLFLFTHPFPDCSNCSLSLARATRAIGDACYRALARVWSISVRKRSENLTGVSPSPTSVKGLVKIFTNFVLKA